MKRDYTNDGRLKVGAKPTYKPAVTVEDLNKNLSVDPDGLINLKAYVRQLIEAAD